MVRRDEQPRQNRGTLMLDTRSSGHRGQGSRLHGASCEWGVSACASIAVWLARRGYSLQLVTTGGVRAAGSTPALAESNILELLSVVTQSRESSSRAASALPRSEPGRPSARVVAVLGISDDARFGGFD